MSADGRRAVSASKDSTLKVWDLETGCELHTPEGHSGDVRGVAVSADGRRTVSASSDHTLKVWDLETGHELRTLEGHSDWVIGVAVSADGRPPFPLPWTNAEGVGSRNRGSSRHLHRRHSPAVLCLRRHSNHIRRRLRRPRPLPQTGTRGTAGVRAGETGGKTAGPTDKTTRSLTPGTRRWCGSCPACRAAVPSFPQARAGSARGGE